MRNTLRLIPIIIFIFFTIGTVFAGGTRQVNDEKPVVFVSIPPQKYFVEKIAGDLVSAEVLIPPGADPHTHEISPKKMSRMASAEIFYAIGLSLERPFIEYIKKTYPKLRIVDTSYGVSVLEGKEDSHIWLDPERLKIIVSNITYGLKKLIPEESDLLDSNLAACIDDLSRVKSGIDTMLSPFRGRAFLIYHASLAYFADAFGLTQYAVETEKMKTTARELSKIILLAKAEGIKTIFVQPQFSMQSATVVAEAIQGSIVQLDHLAEDWEKNIYQIAKKIKRSFEVE
jgi:zinc transport system substrate-binding protein